MRSAQEIATQLQPAILKLESLLVPLSHGGRDGHGTPLATEAVWRSRLLEQVRAANAALVWAHQQLTTTDPGTPGGNPS